MGQEDVILVLERENIALTAKEIREIIKISERATRRAIAMLLKLGEIEKIKSSPTKYSIKK